ncbi:hypothetical protein ACIQ6Y_19485 [Streptomyces sp. NPDC096205]|uniref:hypothetical protein n=1 Tax=Streptomyces sp. NPDC096205 TaxID=3366081 RepID=UPI00381589F8
MYAPPHDPATEQRMRAHHLRAAKALAATVEPGDEFWGWAGHTRSTPAPTTAGAAAWLRLAVAPEDKASGKLGKGAWQAQSALGSLDGRRPALIGSTSTIGDEQVVGSRHK